MTTDSDKKPEKRGRKAGGHNTKQKPIIGQKVEDKFEDKPEPTQYQCWNCGKSFPIQFKHCPDCGSANKWS